MSDSSGSTLTYVLAGLAAAYALKSLLQSETYKLRHIPSAGGPSAPILSIYSVLNVIIRGPAILREAERKYKGRPFKYATVTGWVVAITEPNLIDELGKAPIDVLGHKEATDVLLRTSYTLGKPIAENEYHHNVVRTLLIRNLDTLSPEIHDEVVAAFNDQITLNGNAWTPVSAMTASATIVSRVSNRVFVGLPLCRVPEYYELMRRFTMDVVKTVFIMGLVPKFIQSFVGHKVSTLEATIEECSKYTGPMIRERLQMREKYGNDWPNKPMDALQGLMELAPEDELNVYGMTMRLLSLGFPAIHTSSTVFTSALFHLASRPAECLLPLREEVDAVVAQYGWSRDALQKMHKVDSFLKETLRIDGVISVSALRLALKDFTFSDGTRIPAGTFLAAAAQTVHLKEDIYTDAHQFKPWRFSDMGEKDGHGVSHQIVGTNNEFVPFGVGRFTCPGRHFTANELKTMLAHLVVTYDVKMENEGVLPPRGSFAMTYMVDTKARVLFRKRQPRGASL